MENHSNVLRLAIAHGYIVTTKHETGAGLDARCLAKIDATADEAAVQRWLDRANSYPKLVTALRGVLGGDIGTYEARKDAAVALLRGLEGA